MPKGKKNQEQQESDILKNLGIDAENKEVKGEDKGSGNSDIEKKIEEMSKQLTNLEQENKRLQNTNTALLSAGTGGGSPQVHQPEQEQEIDFSGAPDPYQDPQGYAKFVTERATQQAKTAAERTNREVQQKSEKERTDQQKADALWDEFSEQYTDLAENKDLVEFAAQRVVQRAQNKGVDVNRYMYTTSEQFLEDVAQEANKTIEKFGGGKKAEADEADADVQDDDDEDVDRTAGIFGGQESGGKPSGGAGEDDSPGSLVADIQALQKKDGFF